MQIHALSPELPIEIILEKNAEKVSFNAKVCTYSKEVMMSMSILSQKISTPFIYIDTTMDPQHIIDLWNTGWKMKISAIIDYKHYSFIPEDVKFVALPNHSKYLVVFDVDNEDVDERRGAYRFPINIPALLISHNHIEPVHAILRDLSITGAGLLVDKNVHCRIGEQITISFVTEGLTQMVHGNVIRITEPNDKNYLIGCKINSSDLK